MTAGGEALAIARLVAEAAGDRSAKDVVVLDVSEKLGIAEVFVLASGTSERQVAAIVDEIEKRAYESGLSPRREGNRDEPWVLLDFFDVIAHVQHVEARAMYALDRLWKDCPALDLDKGTITLPAPPGQVGGLASSSVET